MPRLAEDLAHKADIKQFRQACAELRMSARERQEASIALHDRKQAAGMRSHMSYGDLLAWLRQWKAEH